MSPRDELNSLIYAHNRARAVHVAAHLGLADLILSGTTTAEGLAQATGVDPWRMVRFMRYLVGVGVFRRSSDGYDVTEVGRYLGSDTPQTLLNAALTVHFFYPAWGELETVLKTGQPGYEAATGKKHFDDMLDRPDFAAAFDKAMNELFIPETTAKVGAYDFSQYDRLMDVGGGNGEVLLQLLQANPKMRARLFDLPHVAERAKDRLQGIGLGERCETTGGSFFDPLPKGSDAILLRHIIHDWPEEDALLILKNCREALDLGGRVLIAEAILEDADNVTLPIRLDLSMMVYYHGAERTLDEYRDLLGRAGLGICGVHVATPALSILEAQATT